MLHTKQVTNKRHRESAGDKRNLINSNCERQATFSGRFMRRQGMENLVTTGKIEGKRSRDIGGVETIRCIQESYGLFVRP